MFLFFLEKLSVKEAGEGNARVFGVGEVVEGIGKGGKEGLHVHLHVAVCVGRGFVWHGL